jgi:hypothetical protein
MSTKLDWGHAYQETERSTLQALLTAKAEGRVRYMFGQGGPSNLAPCDPSRTSESRLRTLAREHAERVVQRGINQQS